MLGDQHDQAKRDQPELRPLQERGRVLMPEQHPDAEVDGKRGGDAVVAGAAQLSKPAKENAQKEPALCLPTETHSPVCRDTPGTAESP